MTLDAPPPASTMRRDLTSAYIASGAKVFSWTVVTALIFRFGRPDYFAVFLLVRSTIGLLNYTTLGLAPAVVYYLAQRSPQRAIAIEPLIPAQAAVPSTVAYSEPTTPRGRGRLDQPTCDVLLSALALAVWLAILAAIVTLFYADWFATLHRLNGMRAGQIAGQICTSIGIGISLRLFSDFMGAVLQTVNRIAEDNLALAVTELVWIVLTLFDFRDGGVRATDAATTFFFASAFLLVLRSILLLNAIGIGWIARGVDSYRVRKTLLSFGLLVSLAQLADFLYAPTDFILIRHLLYLVDIATYGPAVQIDAALLLIVGGLASVLLPKAALAYASADDSRLRAYYVRGTLVSTGLLIAAAVAVWALAPLIFKLWLGDSTPATQAILPLILIHTVVGGSSAVGRSILLGMGKVKPFTIAVLIAGVSNVILSYSFVRFGGMGLNGIVLGTICAVVGRCAVWQPWYVWRCLRAAGD